MKIHQLYTYPIKSLRPTITPSTNVTKHGFPYDRRFMLLKLHPNNDAPKGGRYENMHVVYFPAMTLFLTSMTFPTEKDPESGTIHVNYKPPSGESKSLDVPLLPSTAGLKILEITMHQSSTKCYDMGDPFNAWFSSCFGFDVVLAYLGDNRRGVLMSVPPQQQQAQSTTNSSWLSTLTNSIPFLPGSSGKGELGFADCASYMVTSQTSLLEASSRLDGGAKMDITKFRPNIVIEGAAEPWEEDYWAEIAIGDAKLVLVHNCVRCASINVDYETGQLGKGGSGDMFKKLQKDRRVDRGAKYSPVFGRYGFLDAADDGKVIRIGDEVNVIKRNVERTVFDWPGLSNAV
ncbi:hypothetical protein K490DRAFT_64475 [Saccharata proteae CBS 121410]|uniref:MOSC domain-containing protein n=1 Tax=Saccharata proteae CBS 121410 TaxID=1314787 RepID=A0A9P4LWE3_9PEZI|nr:hypothetical protein K490DRAFT_64475 [Saccharata proteae CBS 121410]